MMQWLKLCPIFIISWMFYANGDNLASVKGCYDKFMTLYNPAQPKLIEVNKGAEVLLHCDYCGVEESNFGAKLWFYSKRGRNSSLKEVGTSIGKHARNLRTRMTVSHVLVIKNFEKKDSGIYFCKDLDSPQPFVFSYILDVGLPVQVNKISGSYNKWLRFKREKIDVKNYLLDKKLASNETQKPSEDSYKINYCWEDWGPCQVQERHNSMRKKLGKCCLHPTLKSSIDVEYYSLQENLTSENIIDTYDILCRSIILNETRPKISLLVRSLPDFELTEACAIGTDISKQFTGRIARQTSRPKTIIKKIPEYGHFTLQCSAVPYNTANVEWYKNNKLINETFKKNMAFEEDPHIFIDSHNTLFILHATKNEHGIYTCISNGVTLQKVDVRILTHSKLLNQDFFRYSRYLGFVLSLTVTCYCAGICVAWHRRTSFADPLNIINKKRLRGHQTETKKLLY